MVSAPPSTQRLDRLAIGLSGLCVAHCLATAIVVALLASAGGILGAPIVHEAGMAIAMLLAALALGRGVMEHGLLLPAGVGVLGLAMMGAALSVVHGSPFEIAGTVAGVLTLALAHRLNGLAAE